MMRIMAPLTGLLSPRAPTLVPQRHHPRLWGGAPRPDHAPWQGGGHRRNCLSHSLRGGAWAVVACDSNRGLAGCGSESFREALNKPQRWMSARTRFRSHQDSPFRTLEPADRPPNRPIFRRFPSSLTDLCRRQQCASDLVQVPQGKQRDQRRRVLRQSAIPYLGNKQIGKLGILCVR